MAPPDHRRRALSTAIIATALAPRAVAAPRSGLRVVGFLTLRADPPANVAKALSELGYVEGRDFRFETRTHSGVESAALAEGARELVAARPDVMMAFWPYEIEALRAASRTIPIVCGPVPDPVAAGFARSLRRPGGNVTGLSTGSHEIWEFVIGAFRALRPGLRRILVVHSPGMPVTVQMGSHREAARAAGLEWSHAAIANVAEAEKALARFAGEAIHFAPISVPGLDESVMEIAHRLRAITFNGPSGCLMAYTRHFSSTSRRLAGVLDQVLRGGDPAEIPFELPDRVRFALNRATARRIGVEFPPDMLMRANVIES